MCENYGNSYDQQLPYISIVITTHNRREKVARLIESLMKSKYPKWKMEIIVIDDASTDGTFEYISTNFPQVKIIRNEEEKLTTESRNIGIRVSRGKYICIIDDDNLVDECTIRELVRFMEEHPEVGATGPIIYFLNDPNRIWCAGVKINYWIGKLKLLGFNTKDDGRFRSPFETESIPNAFCISRTALAKSGLFNSRLFPIHYEEGDLLLRIKKAGFKVMIVPSAKIWHDVPLPKRDMCSTLRLNNPLRVYYSFRNRIIFFWLHGQNKLQKVIVLFTTLILLLYYVLVLLRCKITYKRRILFSMLKGILDGLNTIMRELHNQKTKDVSGLH